MTENQDFLFIPSFDEVKFLLFPTIMNTTEKEKDKDRLLIH